MLQQNTPPDAPVVVNRDGRLSIGGGSLQQSPQAVYSGFVEQRKVLGQQMDELNDTRSSLKNELQQLAASDPGRPGLEARITAIDGRIAAMDKQIADADAQVAKAAAIPGAVVERPRIENNGPPEEFYVLTGIFMFVFLMPLSIAFARRIWKRGSSVVAAFPKEIGERLGRLEQSAEATAIEIERIGEGQRFLTKLFTEGPQARALEAGHAEMFPRGPGDASR
jgi:hypothetical protein